MELSFSAMVKEELSRQFSNDARHCHIAEIGAIIGFCGTITVLSKEQAKIKIQTENFPLAKKYFTLLEKNKLLRVEPSKIKFEGYDLENIPIFQKHNNHYYVLLENI